MSAFWTEYWYVIAFYAIVILLIYLYRSKFQFQGKIIALLRLNWGIKWMESFGKRNSRWLKVVGVIGVIVGYLGMIGITLLLFTCIPKLADPTEPACLSPVVPGVPIPGGIKVPLFQGLLALFICIVIHEASHGIIAAAHKMKVKSSGFVLFGPLPGAFVEPDEKKLLKQKGIVQNAVFAAGPFSNIITGFLFLFLWIGAAGLLASAADPLGFTVGTLSEDGPAMQANLPVDTRFSLVDEQPAPTTAELHAVLSEKEVGQMVVFGTDDKIYAVELGAWPEGPHEGKPWVGIEDIQTVYGLQERQPVLFWIAQKFLEVLFWLWVLSFGLGLANLLPIGPVDGGRMWQIALRKFLGKERGDLVWGKSSLFLLLIVLILVIIPILRSVFF